MYECSRSWIRSYLHSSPPTSKTYPDLWRAGPIFDFSLSPGSLNPSTGIPDAGDLRLPNASEVKAPDSHTLGGLGGGVLEVDYE